LTTLQHAGRTGLLMAVAAALLTWGTRHTETSFADGLRYIHEAERIEAGGWHEIAVHGTDHLLHPLAIAAMHRILPGEGPASWQRAAFWLSFSFTLLNVIPIYLLTLELFGETAAWLACLLVIVNPLTSYLVVNVLSECTFLLPWTFGLWAAVRSLREGRLGWLLCAIGFGVVAYLTRPEGLLLPVAFVATLLTVPLLRATRLDWAQWWRLIACVVIGVVVLVGPYIAMRGGLGTKPGIARVLGLAPWSASLSLEREKPLPPDHSSLTSYRFASVRMLKVLRAAASPALVPFAVLGLPVLALRDSRSRSRSALFLTIVIAASMLALVRLHVTGGYGTTRHGLVPGIVLTILAAGALAWLTSKLALPGRWLGLSLNRVGIPGPVGSLLIVALVLAMNVRGMEHTNVEPFSVYHATGSWLARNATGTEQVLDMTDWSLYFSQRSGYHFADVYKAPADAATRWIVVRQPHVEGHWHFSQIVRELIGGREPVAVIPARPSPGQLQIRIYDRLMPVPRMTAVSTPQGEVGRRR
jgi:hypothetical protein